MSGATEKQTSTVEHLEFAHGRDEREHEYDEKGSVADVHGAALDGEVHVAALEGDGLVKSRFDHLTIMQALWVFRRSLFVCFCVFTGRMLEYFEIVMSGAILANPGFIKQFGNEARQGTKAGVAALDPNWGESPSTTTRARG